MSLIGYVHHLIILLLNHPLFQGAAQGMYSISIILPELIDVSGKDHGHVSLTKSSCGKTSLAHKQEDIDYEDMEDSEAAPREL